MKKSTKTLLKLSLLINVLFAVVLITVYSSMSDWRMQSQELQHKSEMLQIRLIESQRIAQEQAALANRQMIRAQVAAQKALANQFYAKSQAR